MTPAELRAWELFAAAQAVCRQCCDALAYPGAVYCGAACCAGAEMHLPPSGKMLEEWRKRQGKEGEGER